MIFQSPPFPRSSAERTAGLLLSMLLVATGADAAVQDITVGPPVGGACPANTDFSYAAKPGDTVNEIVSVLGAEGAVQWEFALFDDVQGVCEKDEANPKLAHCGGLDIEIPTNPDLNETAPATVKVTVKANVPAGAATNQEGFLTLRVTDTATGNKCATRKYKFRVTKNGGGWGDPHMTTVDDVHYDFQSAGEFIALRADNFEIQTRQRAVPTATVPGPSQYTGLGVCVSIYSAVAARIGSNRVTLQPNLSGQPDPSGLQLRVNGNLVMLTEKGIDLRAGGSSDPSALLEGRIVMAAGGAYEFDDTGGTQLVATPAFWNDQQTWYLNLNVFQTSGIEGIWGRRAPGSWLPALPDGTSLGPMPTALDQRNQDLYTRFADAWRVTNATSLFDYAPGTNTATFTIADWPRFGARSCLIQGQTPAQPTNLPAATQACSAITDPDQKADCTFDVMVTGNLGFAQTYATMQAFRPNGTGWQPALPGMHGTPVPPKTGTGTGWPWWWWILILILGLIVIVVLIAKKKATP